MSKFNSANQYGVSVSLCSHRKNVTRIPAHTDSELQQEPSQSGRFPIHRIPLSGLCGL